MISVKRVNERTRITLFDQSLTTLHMNLSNKIKCLLLFSFCWMSYTATARQTTKLFPNDACMQWMYEQLGEKKSGALKTALIQRAENQMNSQHRAKEQHPFISEKMLKGTTYYYFYGGQHLPTYYLLFSKKGLCISVMKLLNPYTNYSGKTEEVYDGHLKDMKGHHKYWIKNEASLFRKEIKLETKNYTSNQPLVVRQLASGAAVLATQRLRKSSYIKNFMVSVTADYHLNKMVFMGKLIDENGTKLRVIPETTRSFSDCWQQYLVAQKDFNDGKTRYKGNIDEEGRWNDPKAFIGIHKNNKWYYGYARVEAGKVAADEKVGLYDNEACTGDLIYVGPIRSLHSSNRFLLSDKGFLWLGLEKGKPKWKYGAWHAYTNFDDDAKLHGEMTYQMGESQFIDLVYEHGQLKTDLSNVVLYSAYGHKASATFYEGAVNTSLKPDGKGVRYIKKRGTFAMVKGEWTNGQRTIGSNVWVLENVGKYKVAYDLPKGVELKYDLSSDKVIKSVPNGIEGDGVEAIFYEHYPDKPIYRTVGSFKKDRPIGTHRLSKYQNGKWLSQTPIVCSSDIYDLKDNDDYSYLISGLNLFQITTQGRHEELQAIKKEEERVLAIAKAKKDAERAKREAEEAKEYAANAKKREAEELIEKVNARVFSFYCQDNRNCHSKTVIYNGEIFKNAGSGQTTGSHHLFFVNAGPACTLKITCTFREPGTLKVLTKQNFTVYLENGTSTLFAYTLKMNIKEGIYTRNLDVDISGIPSGSNIRMISAYSGKLIDKKVKDAGNDLFRN